MFVSLLRGEAWWVRLVCVLAGLGAIFSVLWNFAGAWSDSWDAHLIVGATNAFAHQLDPYRAWLNFQHGLAPDPGFEAQYPPSTYVLLLPLLLVPWPALTWLLAAANVAAGIFLILQVQRIFLPSLRPAQTALMIFAFLIATPFQAEVLHGQISAFALLAFVLAQGSVQQGRRVAATLWLVLALAKFTLTLPLALVLVRRKGLGVILAAGMVHVMLTLAAAAWLGETPLALIVHLREAESHSLFAGYINFSNILSAFGKEGGLAGQWLSGAVALAAAGTMAIRRVDPLPSLSLLALVSALCVYHASYDMMLFVFPFALVVRTFCLERFYDQTFRMRAAIALLCLSIALLWFVIEPADNMLSMLSARHFSGYAFSDPHVMPLWYVLMLSVTAALALLFALAWAENQGPGSGPARRTSKS